MFLSDDSSERDSVIMYRAMFNVVGAVVGTAMHGQILASYRRSEHDPCDNVTYSANSSTNSSEGEPSLEMTRTGYMISSATLCCLLMLSLTAIVFGTTERKDISATSGGERGQNILRTAMTVLSFRPNMYFLLAYFFIQVPLSIGHGSIALYVQYSLDLEDQIENVFLVFMASSAIAVPIIGWVVSKLGKRISYVCFELAAIPVYIGFQFIPNGSFSVYAVTVGVGFTALAQIVIPCGLRLLSLTTSGSNYLDQKDWGSSPRLMVSDIIEDCYLQTGERLDTPFIAIFLSTNSLAITVGLITATVGLEIGGYKLGSCNQPDMVGSALRILVSTCTSVLAFVGVVFAWRYPITEERRKEIIEAINKRLLGVSLWCSGLRFCFSPHLVQITWTRRTGVQAPAGSLRRDDFSWLQIAGIVVKTPQTLQDKAFILTNQDGLATVTLKVENAVNPSCPSTVTEVEVPPGTSVYNMLLQAFYNGAITFQASWYGQFWSHFIYSINGLEEDDKQGTYWSFEDGQGSAFDRGENQCAN
ncbi:MFSD2A [Branchiostoma lanceolatum]|nr:MFSD2A [Branchiostoma lanceolatum]